MNIAGKLVVADPGQSAPTLFIFGAGHVARPTAHLAAMVGFDVVVLDDRSEFADAARFPGAAGVHTISAFDKAVAGLEVMTDTFIIIIMNGSDITAIVLAAGLSQRMGRFKPLLPLGASNGIIWGQALPLAPTGPTSIVLIPIPFDFRMFEALMRPIAQGQGRLSWQFCPVGRFQMC